jgi:hypothetical protein
MGLHISLGREKQSEGKVNASCLSETSGTFTSLYFVIYKIKQKTSKTEKPQLIRKTLWFDILTAKGKCPSTLGNKQRQPVLFTSSDSLKSSCLGVLCQGSVVSLKEHTHQGNLA